MANNVTLEIYSEDGDVQVLGDGGIGFGLSATGNLTLVDDGQAHPQPMVVGTVTVTGTNPILAWKGVGAICLERITVSGSTFTFRLRAKSNTNIGLQYWVFDTAASATKDPTMAGIEAAFYDQYGVVTFDATMAAMRIVDAIETPKDSEVLPVGNFANLGGYTNVTVPSGKVYAVVQSTVGFVMTTYDTGAYSNSPTRPNQIEIGDGGEPGPGMRWRYQRLESYQSTGGYTSANNIRVGMTQFEAWEVGWQPASATPHITVYGQARHMIVDVTNFTSATAPNPTVVTGGVNATSRSVSTGGASTITQSVTPSVTVTASGGTAPYSYFWERISGDTTVVANGSATAASFSTSTANQPQSTTRSAVWRCRITDKNGIVGYAPEVTFTHTAQAYSVDVTPDPLVLNNISLYTNEASGYTNDCDFRVWGINQTINLQFTRGNQWDSGGIFTRRLFIYHSVNNGASWTEYFIGAGVNGIANIAVNNGDRIIMRAYMDTTAGRGDTSFTAYITNTTAGVSLGSISVSGTVDADNNYNNTDTTPDTITNWPSINGVVNENDYSWSTSSYGEHYVNGINQPITLRAEVYDYSGNLDALYMDVFTWPPGAGGWTHHGYFAAHVAGPDGLRKLDIGNVVNGTRVAVNPHAITNSGRKSATCRLVLWSVTGVGGQFASANQSFVVDNDNNYNIGGAVTPVDWPNMSVFLNSTNGSSSSPNYSNGPTRTISGLASGQTATISLSGSADGDAQGWVEIWKNGVNQGLKFLSPENSNTVNTNYAAVSVANGDTINFRVGVNGPLATQFNTPVSVYKSLAVTVNASPGGAIDTFNANLSHSDSYSSGGGIGDPGGPIIRD